MPNTTRCHTARALRLTLSLCAGLAALLAPLATHAAPRILYVRNGDIDKALTIKPASPLYAEPDLAATIVTYAEEGDSITITGLRGRWTQVELDKVLPDDVPTTASEPSPTSTPPDSGSSAVAVPPLTSSAEPATVEPALAPEPETQPATEVEAPPAPLEIAEAVVADPLPESDALAQPATAAARQIEESAPAQPAYKPALTRNLLQGKLVRTRRFLSPQRGYAYDWQLNAKFNFRVAYLDFSRMQGTEQLAQFAGQPVAVYGLVSPLGDGQYVMEVESIRLQ